MDAAVCCQRPVNERICLARSDAAPDDRQEVVSKLRV
jgi:hypothetical protein